MGDQEEKITLKVHPVGVAIEPKDVVAPPDATLDDVLVNLIEKKYLPKAANGQDWKFKIGAAYADESKTLRQLGIQNGDDLKVVQEQRWAKLG